MKKTILIGSFFAATLFSTQASTVLIGGTTLDGDFEDGGASNQDALTTSGGWTTMNGELVQIRTNNTTVSGNNAVVGHQNLDNGSNLLTFGRSTGYTIQTGDQFDGGFSWRDKFGWDTGDGSVIMSLFYTDTNAIDGVNTVLFSWASGNEVTNDTTENETFGLTVAGDADGGVGKTLFVRFDTPAAGEASFSRLDEVFLNVTSVPEPSSTALLGLGGLALALRRRK